MTVWAFTVISTFAPMIAFSCGNFYDNIRQTAVNMKAGVLRSLWCLSTQAVQAAQPNLMGS